MWPAAKPCPVRWWSRARLTQVIAEFVRLPVPVSELSLAYHPADGRRAWGLPADGVRYPLGAPSDRLEHAIQSAGDLHERGSGAAGTDRRLLGGGRFPAAGRLLGGVFVGVAVSAHALLGGRVDPLVQDMLGVRVTVGRGCPARGGNFTLLGLLGGLPGFKGPRRWPSGHDAAPPVRGPEGGLPPAPPLVPGVRDPPSGGVSAAFAARTDDCGCLTRRP